MSDELNFDHLSDREILILTCQRVMTHEKRINAHGQQIDSLRDWRNWNAGAGAVLAGLLGIHVKGH